MKQIYLFQGATASQISHSLKINGCFDKIENVMGTTFAPLHYPS